MVMCITVAPIMLKAIRHSYEGFYHRELEFEFKKIKHIKLNIIMTIIVSLASIGGIVTLFVYNDEFFKWRESYYDSSEQLDSGGHEHQITGAGDANPQDNPVPNGQNNGPVTPVADHRDVTMEVGNIYDFDKATGAFTGSNITLSNDKYNQILSETHDDEIALVVIADGVIYKEFIPFHGGEDLWTYMDTYSQTFEFRHYYHDYLGEFVNSFSFEGSSWMHGTRTDTNYGDFYPIFYRNHVESSLGVSSTHPFAHDVYEFTYDQS